MQIRTKLTLQFIVLVAGILLLSLFIIYVKFQRMTEDEFYNGLRSKALMTAEMVLHDEEKIAPLGDHTAEEEPVLPFRENVVIYNAAYKRVFAFNRAAPPVPNKTLQNMRACSESRFMRGDFHVLGLRHTSKSGREYFIVAEAVFNPEELKSLRNILILSFFLCIGIVAIGGWFYAGQAMSPVARIVNQVDHILPSDLSARLDAPNNHDEISRLVLTFNRLLDRIQFAFRMQKSFISNVSHELKNPLSVIISQLEISLDRQKRSTEEYRDTLASVLEDTRELNNVTEKLLQLARVHSEGANITFERVRLDEIMLQTRATLLRLHPDYHIAFDIVGLPDDEEQLCVLGNEPLLRSAFQNLMDNGCKFSPDKKVEVKIWFDPAGKHHVEIADQGPGIPAKDLQLIFQPFYRSSQNIHVRGSGIGLSLVDSIMRLHRVALDVTSAQGRGTTFKLSFPAMQ
ncbi:MAG: HAMP domain-containing histidine kinase [Saprospiraceae bacterium]|nr:HAMP domain-containing histidine kinase [Saprospiraceae bacterium]